MGYGDAIMATALARGLNAKGKFAIFSKNGKIKWTGYCEDVFANNPNIGRPGSEYLSNAIWFPHYKGKVPYCKYDGYSRHLWNSAFRTTPGEFYFTEEELTPLVEKPYVMIEPNLAWNRHVSINKDWGGEKYERLASALMARGVIVVQCVHENSRRIIPGAKHVVTSKFRDAARVMKNARLVIGPEGANHHAAAALNVPAMILWGDWSPPHVMGYKGQIYFVGKERRACGSVLPCSHCREVFNRITVEEVYESACRLLGH